MYEYLTGRDNDSRVGRVLPRQVSADFLRSHTWCVLFVQEAGVDQRASINKYLKQVGCSVCLLVCVLR